MFSHPIGRSTRHLGQSAYRSRLGLNPSTFKANGQRRCYAEAARSECAPPWQNERSDRARLIIGAYGRIHGYLDEQKQSGRGLSMALLGLAFTGVGAAGMWYTMTRSMGILSDAESLRQFVPADEEARLAEESINNHPFVKELRSRSELTESRPHMKMPAEHRACSLTAGTLQGPGKLVVPPFAWIDDDGKSIISVAYIGDQLCGHPGIVHGGLLAMMLDEGLARCCFAALHNKVAVTAKLEIDYRKPTLSNNLVVLRGRTIKVEGRKAWAEGRIETLVAPGEKPTILVEAKGLFISPKYAAVSSR